MSNIVLQPNASGTGNITIATPNTNTDRTLNIPDVAGNFVTTGDTGTISTTMLGTGLDLSGKVTTGHETLSSHVVTETFGSVGYTTSSANVSLGYLDIPGPGIWKVEAQLRIRWASTTYFAKMFLSTTDNSLTGEIYRAGAGANTAVRMLYERLGNNGFGNLLITPSWIIDVPTGLTSGDRIYFIIQPSGADGSALNNNDDNGRPGAQGMKIAETTTSGTTITARGL